MGDVIDQDDDQRATAPKVDLRNALSLYPSPSLGYYHGPHSSSPQNRQPLVAKLDEILGSYKGIGVRR